MKTLHRYITGQVLASLTLTVAVFAFVVLLLNVLQGVLPLLLSGQAPLGVTLKAIGLLLPFSCVYALPMGFITATLLVFGRFSADQELTAMRASGVSLLSLITPVLLLSLLCCSLSAWFNMEIGPRSRVEFLKLKAGLLNDIANAQVPEGRLVTFEADGKRYQFYVGKNRNGQMEDVNIYRMQNETNWDYLIHAPSGHFVVGRETNQLVLVLDNARMLKDRNVSSCGAARVFNFSTKSVTNQAAMKPKISDMTFGQLQQELRELQQQKTAAVGTNAFPILPEFPAFRPTNASPAEISALLRQFDIIRGQQIQQVRSAMHREVAFSFACFGFTLVGIPLGIRVHRRETNIGMMIALLLVVVYYGFTIFGDTLSSQPAYHPHLIFWIPNLIFQAVGVFLLWRANRGI